jgi:hypothetical protein
MGGVNERTITRTWLRFDDCRCVRGDHWAGPEGDTVYVVAGQGLVCPEHITAAEHAVAEVSA